MKLLNTLQTLVDKTKELEETVATQTSTIERLTSQLYLANKDNASDNNIKQEYQELRDKFINTLYGVSIINNAINNKYIYLDVSDIYAFNRISIHIVRPEKEDCYKVEEYGYFINLDNATTEIPETLDKIVEKVTSIVNLATGNDNDNNHSCQPIVDRMIKDILSVKCSRVSPLLAFLVHYHYIEHYRCNFRWQPDIERYKLEFTFDYNGKEYKLSDNETIDFTKRLLIKLYTTNQSDTVRDQLITNFIEWCTEHYNKQ